MNSNFQKNPLAMLVASLGLLSAMPAKALVTENLSAQTSLQIGLNAPIVDGPNANSTYVKAFSTHNVFNRTASYTYSYGYRGGRYGSTHYGTGTFDSIGQFKRQWDIRNDSNVAQNYSLDFYLYSGMLAADAKNVVSSASGGHSEFLVNVIQDGSTPLFSSGAKVTSNGAVTTSGTVLPGAKFSNTYLGNQYSWDSAYFTVALGRLNAGDATSVQFELTTRAFGDYGSYSIPCYPEQYAPCGSVAAGLSYLNFGDSNPLLSTPLSGFGIRAEIAPVPEPSTWAMLIAGLGLVGFSTHRRLSRR